MATSKEAFPPVPVPVLESRPLAKIFKEKERDLEASYPDEDELAQYISPTSYQST